MRFYIKAILALRLMYPFFVRRKLLTVKDLNQCVGRDSVVGISQSLQAGRSGDRIPDLRFTPLVQTVPETHLDFYKYPV